MADTHRLALFAPGSSRAFGSKIAEHLGVALASLEEREFEDGEHKSRPLESVRGRDVFVVHSLYGEPAASPNDKLIRLLFLLGALREAGARQVTAVIPYLCYARKDARTQSRDPVTTRYVAQLFEAQGVDRIVVLEVHNTAAYQNAFRIRSEHLSATTLFAEHILRELARGERLVVVSPDPGGFKRADRLRAALSRRLGREVGLASMEKARARGELRTGRLVGEVAGCTAIIIDDIIASGSTLAAAARSCRLEGSSRVLAVASHGLFIAEASRMLADDALDRVIVTDSVPPFRLVPKLVQTKLEVVSIAPMFADAIARLHEDRSLVELLET